MRASACYSACLRPRGPRRSNGASSSPSSWRDAPARRSNGPSPTTCAEWCPRRHSAPKAPSCNVKEGDPHPCKSGESQLAAGASEAPDSASRSADCLPEERGLSGRRLSAQKASPWGAASFVDLRNALLSPLLSASFRNDAPVRTLHMDSAVAAPTSPRDVSRRCGTTHFGLFPFAWASSARTWV
jgi:hypothetical protein